MMSLPTFRTRLSQYNRRNPYRRSCILIPGENKGASIVYDTELSRSIVYLHCLRIFKAASFHADE